MEIRETSFGPKKYIAIKKSIPMSQITDKQMYDDAGKKLGAYVREHSVNVIGPWSVIYFTWDDATKTTDIAIAFPVSELESVSDPDFSIVEVGRSKASVGTHMGSYERIGDAHMEMMNYIKENGYDVESVLGYSIEEYVAGPIENPDESTWRTDIYYLHA
ncbi:MAG TPA: GyrI-like domain-containing protein [Candidatus Paceibacterota bacterium]